VTDVVAGWLFAGLWVLIVLRFGGGKTDRAAVARRARRLTRMMHARAAPHLRDLVRCGDQVAV
jgi:hypothetical protein